MSSLNQIISSDLDDLILVDPDDQDIGTMSKRDCHRNAGSLHRAFSVFIFNSAGDVLLQQRSDQKSLWPLYWSNACCSHPRAGENSQQAAHRRIKQELGINVELTYLYKFQYQAHYEQVGSEHELCWVWIGFAEAADVIPNTNEIVNWRFFPKTELDAELLNNPAQYTPWMKMEWQRILSDHSEQLRQ